MTRGNQRETDRQRAQARTDKNSKETAKDYAKRKEKLFLKFLLYLFNLF